MKILKLCNLFYGLTRFGGIEWGQPIAPPGKTLSKKHNVLLQNSEILNKIVAKHNIRGKYVGAGAFSVVYSDGVIVTKITPYKKDAYKLFVLEQLKDKVPEKYKKHILEIFDLDYDSEYNVYILAIEYLVPVTSIPETAAIISPDSPVEWTLKIKSVLRNIPYLTALYEQYVQSIPEPFKKILTSIKFEFIDNLSKLTVPNNIHRIEFDMFLLKNLDDLIENPFNNYALMLDKNELKAFKANYLELFKSLQNFMYFLTDTLIQKSKMPRSFKELKNEEEQGLNSTLYSKDVKDLLEFLKYLKTHKISYFDAHRDNIMLRPGTNDLVISDPGSYIIS